MMFVILYRRCFIVYRLIKSNLMLNWCPIRYSTLVVLYRRDQESTLVPRACVPYGLRPCRQTKVADHKNRRLREQDCWQPAVLISSLQRMRTLSFNIITFSECRNSKAPHATSSTRGTRTLGWVSPSFHGKRRPSAVCRDFRIPCIFWRFYITTILRRSGVGKRVVCSYTDN